MQRVADIKYSLSVKWCMRNIENSSQARPSLAAIRSSCTAARRSQSHQRKAKHVQYSNELNGNAFAFVINKNLIWSSCSFHILVMVWVDFINFRYIPGWFGTIKCTEWAIQCEWIEPTGNLCQCYAYCYQNGQICSLFIDIWKSNFHWVRLWHFIETQIGEWWPRAKEPLPP